MYHAPSWRACLLAAAPLTLTLPAFAGYYQISRFDDTAPTTGGMPGDLRYSLIQANADPGSSVFVPGPNTVTLQGPLPIITTTMSVSGYGTNISGNNLHRIFFVDAPGATVSISNFTLQNGRAKGGNGGQGGGGGGLGAGGAIFCNRGNVQAYGLTFLNNSATGGNGGDGDIPINQAGGKGGGGGGGGALGGEVFVRETATFSSQDCTFGGATLTPGAGGAMPSTAGVNSNAPLPGAAAGSSIFTRGIALSFDCGLDQTVSGSLADDLTLPAAGLTKNGNAILTLSGGNSYRGTVTINSGILSVPTLGASPGAASPLGAGGTVQLAGGTLRYTGASGILSHPLALVSSTSTLQVSSAAATVEATGAMSGTAGLTKTGAGTLVLNGTGSFTGNVNVNAGTLQVGSTGFPASSPVTIANGATVVIDRSDTLDLEGLFSGSGQLIKRGSGTLRLNNTNTHSGGTKLQAGRFEIANNAAFGTGTLTVTGGHLRATSLPRTVANPLALNGSFSIGRLTTLSGNGTIPSPITITAENPDAPANGDSTFSGALGGTGPLNFAVGGFGLGTGSIVLGGANTFTGGVNVGSNVRLKVSSDANLGAAGGALSFTTGSSLRLGGDLITTRAVTLNADTTFELGGFTAEFASISGYAVTLEAGTLRLAGGLNSGHIAGAGALVKTGPGTLKLTIANAHTGGTTIQAGRLEIGHNAVFGTGTLTLAGGHIRATDAPRTVTNPLALTGSFSIGRQTTLSGNGTIASPITITAENPDGAANGDTNFSGNLGGTGPLTFAVDANGLGSGAFVLSGTNTFTGGVVVGSGARLRVFSDANFGAAAGGVTLAGGGKLKPGASITTARALNVLAGGGEIEFSTHNLTFASLDGSEPLTLTGGQLTVGGGTYSGVLSGSGSLTMAGPGTLLLGGSNTYTGGTSLQGGILGIGHNTALGTGTLTISGGNIRAVGAPRHLANAVTVNDSFTVGRATNFTGPVTLNSANLTITADNPDGVANSDANFSGAIGGNSTLAIAAGPNGLGSGAIVFSGTNTYSGSTTLLSGSRLGISSDASLGAAANGLSFSGGKLRLNGTVNSTRTLTLQSGGGEIETNSYNGTFGNLTGTSLLTKSGTGTLALTGTLNHAGNVAVTGGTLQLAAGSLSGVVSGTGALTKDSASTLTLSADNSYTGTTTVDAGTLQLSGQSTSDAFSIASAAVLDLAIATGERDYAPASGAVSFSGTGTLRKSGAGTIRWNASAATFALGAGSLIDVQGGVFVGGSFANEVWTNNLSGLNVASGAEFNGVEANVRVDVLTGSGIIRTGFGAIPANSLTFGVNGGSGTFAGTLADNGSSPAHYRKAGTGTQALTGDSTHTGGTDILAGTLQIGDFTTTGSLAGNVNNAGTLAFRRINAHTFAGAVSGTGTTSNGGGTLTLSGTSPSTGTLSIDLGRVILSGSWAGAFDATSRLSLAGGSIGSPGSNHVIRSQGSLDGTGTVTGNVSNSGYITAGAGETITFSGGTVTNAPGGVLLAISGGSLNFAAATGLVNNGMIDLMSGTVTFPANFTNNGVLLDSRVVKVSSATRSGDVITIKMHGYEGHSYQLQKSTSLTADSFVNVGSRKYGEDAELTFTDSEGAPKAFYRVVVD